MWIGPYGPHRLQVVISRPNLGEQKTEPSTPNLKLPSQFVHIASRGRAVGRRMSSSSKGWAVAKQKLSGKAAARRRSNSDRTHRTVLTRVSQHNELLSHGALVFKAVPSGSARRRVTATAGFVVVKDSASPEMLCSLLERDWRLPPPSVLLSVTGSAQAMHLAGAGRIRSDPRRGGAARNLHFLTYLCI